MRRMIRAALLGCAAIVPTILWVAPADADATNIPLLTSIDATLTAMEGTLGTINGELANLLATARAIETTLNAMSASMSAITPFPPTSGPAAATAGVDLGSMISSLQNGVPAGSPDMISSLVGYVAKFNLHDAFLLGATGKTADLEATAYKISNGAVAAAVADQSYKRANESMLRLEAYLAELKASTSLKKSVDINTRVLIEVGQQLNESLRTQAAMTSMAGAYFMSTGVRATEFNKLLLGVAKYIR